MNATYIIFWIVQGIAASMMLYAGYIAIKSMNRVDKVCKFKLHVLRTYPLEVFDLLPSYEEMISDGKELKIENYVPNYLDFGPKTHNI